MNDTIKAFEKLGEIDYSASDARVDPSKLNGVPVKEARLEWMKFMALCATDKEANAPSKAVDEIWHTTILDTQVYEEVGKKLGVFIHHDQNVPKYAPYFDGTVKKVEAIFGSVNPRAWKTGYANCGYGGCGPK